MSKCQRIALASLYKLIRSLLKYGRKGKPTLLQNCLLNPLVESILQAKLIYQVSKASKRNLSKGWFFCSLYPNMVLSPALPNPGSPVGEKLEIPSPLGVPSVLGEAM